MRQSRAPTMSVAADDVWPEQSTAFPDVNLEPAEQRFSIISGTLVLFGGLRRRSLPMILGGGFSDPKYTYEDRDAKPPFSRLPTHGIRLVKNIDPQPAASLAAMPRPARDYSVEKPIDDTAFEIVKGMYAYDSRPLDSPPRISRPTSSRSTHLQKQTRSASSSSESSRGLPRY